MMRFRMPSNALAFAIGALAFAIATTGGAIAATGQVINIADGTTAANVAKVDSTGALRVGDGSGPLSVDGRVTVGVPKPFTAIVHVDSVINGQVCTTVDFSLPTGVPVLIERAVVNFYGARATDNPRASLRLSRKTGTTQQTFEVSVPTNVEDAFSRAGGSQEVNVVVRGNALSAAADGDIYAASACFNRGSYPYATPGDMIILGLR